MITIKTNIEVVSASVLKKLEKLKNREYLLRPVALDMIPIMTERIHQSGKASDGGQVGTYSDAYMKIRTGNYGNASKISRGPNKGKAKDAGTSSRGANKGKQRTRYNRSSDTKVIVSLTRQLENDWSVIATEKGYGIGFLNELNLKKAGWVEATYNKSIFKLTKEEKEFATQRLQQLIKDALHS